MFDISFFEIVLICIVSLLVLGPDKLPVAIRTAGLWIGRLKRSFNNIKTDIEREVGADEIRRQLRNEAIMEKIKNTKGQFTESIQSVKKEVQSAADSASMKDELASLGKDGKGSNTSDPTAQQLAGNQSADPAASPAESGDQKPAPAGPSTDTPKATPKTQSTPASADNRADNQSSTSAPGNNDPQSPSDK